MIENLSKIGNLVARYLTLGDYRDYSSRFDILNPEEVIICCDTNPLLTFHIRPDWRNPDRLLIQGIITHAARQVTDCRDEPEITVAANRDPAAIAKDILRRFMPAWDKFAAKAAEAEQRHKDRCRKIQALADRLIELSGGLLHRSHNGRSEDRVELYGPAGTLRKIDIYSPDNLEIQCYTGPETAARLVQVLFNP